MSSIRPLHDRVLVERDAKEETTAGGLVLPDNAKEKPVMGFIVEVGSGKRLDNGSQAPLSVAKGDKVLFGQYAGTEVKIGGTQYLVMREDDILAVIQE
jgi:chaperonin GroES